MIQSEGFRRKKGDRYLFTILVKRYLSLKNPRKSFRGDWKNATESRRGECRNPFLFNAKAPRRNVIPRR